MPVHMPEITRKKKKMECFSASSASSNLEQAQKARGLIYYNLIICRHVLTVIFRDDCSPESRNSLSAVRWQHVLEALEKLPSHAKQRSGGPSVDATRFFLELQNWLFKKSATQPWRTFIATLCFKIGFNIIQSSSSQYFYKIESLMKLV